MVKAILKGLVLSALVMVFQPGAAHATSSACKIWLCLPAGFPSGCSDAHTAMIKRIRHFKPPLPSFGSCAVNPEINTGSHMSFTAGQAAWMPATQTYIKGTTCHHHHGHLKPRGCGGTFYYADVFIEGQPAGPTYFFQ